MTTAHSKIGPSALSRLLKCPGSHALTEKLPPGRSSVYAAQGSVAHEIVEASLLDEAPHSLGDLVTYEGFDIRVDDEMIEGTDLMINFCRSLMHEADKVWVEKTVDMGAAFPSPPPEPFFGTVDFAAYIEKLNTLYVVDFKYGRGDVDPEDNPQLMSYALGAVLELGSTPENIVITVIQPRGQGSAPVKVWAISGMDFTMWTYDVLIPGIDALFQPGALLYPGSHCQFCPGKIRCPALKKVAQDVSRSEFSGMPVDPVTLTDDELGDVMDKAELLAWFVAAARAEASQRLEKGRNIPNWKLVPKRAMRKWTDAYEVEDILKERMDPDLIYKKTVQTPTQIQKLDPVAYDFLDEAGFVDKSSSGTTLVPDVDPRETIKGLTAKEEFAEL